MNKLRIILVSALLIPILSTAAPLYRVDTKGVVYSTGISSSGTVSAGGVYTSSTLSAQSVYSSSTISANSLYSSGSITANNIFSVNTVSANGMVSSGTVTVNTIHAVTVSATTGTFSSLTSSGSMTANIFYGRPALYCYSHLASTVSGTTGEVTLFTCPITAGFMGPNSTMRITNKWSYTNNSTNKTLKVMFGGLAVKTLIVTTTATQVEQITGQNRNSYSDQIWSYSGTAASSSFASSVQSFLTGTVDTSQSQTLILTGQTASALSSITLETVDVEILN